MKHDFVQGDSNKVLKPIDNKQLTQLAYGTITSITGILNYWTARIQKGIPGNDIVKLTTDLLDFIHHSLKIVEYLCIISMLSCIFCGV